MRWQKAKLGDVCRIVSGSTPSTNVSEYWGGDIWWATPKDLSELSDIYIQETQQRITEPGYRSCSTELLPVGSVLFSSRAPIGHVAINAVPMCTNQGFKSFIPLANRLDSRYLYFWLKANRTYLESLGNGATFKELSKATVERLEIPLPPLTEQQSISAVLEQATTIRQKRKEVIVKLDALLQAAFLDKFGDPLTNPKGWQVKPISELGSVTTGNTPSRARPEYYGPGIEWIKSDNINTPHHYLTLAEETLSMEGEKVARVVPAGSVLVTCIAGTPSCIGNSALADRRVAFNQQINAITPYKDIDPYFLYTQLLVGKKLVQQASTNSMKGMVSKNKFSAIELMCPPAEMQSAFGKRFLQIHALRENMQKSLAAAEVLFSSLQLQAFTGGFADRPAQIESQMTTLPGYTQEVSHV